MKNAPPDVFARDDGNASHQGGGCSRTPHASGSRKRNRTLARSLWDSHQGGAQGRHQVSDQHTASAAPIAEQSCAVAFPPAPGYVYFMVYQAGQRFKIGHSVEPLGRLLKLPEADRVDQNMSLHLEVTDAARSRKIESALHKLLDPYRISKWDWQWNPSGFAVPVQGDDGTLHMETQGWDGSTEWFNLLCWPYAVQLLRQVAMGLDGAGLDKLTSFNGEPLNNVDSSPENGLTAPEAQRYNNNRLRLMRMHMRLVEMAQHRSLRHELLRVMVPPARPHLKGRPTAELASCPSQHPRRASAARKVLFPKRLWIMGLADAWSVQSLELKREVMDACFWALESKQGLVHLAKAIRYVATPRGQKALEIEFHWEKAAEVSRLVSRMAKGKEIMAIWQTVCQAMEKMGDELRGVS